MTSSSHSSVKYLLLQVRDADDPMISQERTCFCEAVECKPHQLDVFDLTQGRQLSARRLSDVDIVLIGGSGNYSVAERGDWWLAAEESMQLLSEYFEQYIRYRFAARIEKGVSDKSGVHVAL